LTDNPLRERTEVQESFDMVLGEYNNLTDPLLEKVLNKK
jgi:hypothetical protein